MSEPLLILNMELQCNEYYIYIPFDRKSSLIGIALMM